VSAINNRTAGAQRGEGVPQLTKLPNSLLETLQDTRRRCRRLYSQASCDMSNWDYWRGTFEAAQAQAQVAASQASKFAEVVSAQVRTYMHLSCRMPMAAIFTHAGLVPKSARPLTSSCC
jgi:hypothetical protein